MINAYGFEFDGDNPLNQGFDIGMAEGGVIATFYYCENGEGKDYAEANAKLFLLIPDMAKSIERAVETYKWIRDDHPKLDPDGDLLPELRKMLSILEKVNGLRRV